MSNQIYKKKMSIILMVTMLLTLLCYFPQQKSNAQAKAGITNVDFNPEIIYVREGQSKNLFNCISSLSYVDSSGKTKSYSDSNSAGNALKSLTQNIKLTNTGGSSSLIFDQNGNVKAAKNGNDDPIVTLSFSSGNVEIKLIIQDAKPDIENERFDIYDDGESDGKMQVFLEYPDNTANHQYRVGNGSWQNVDADFTDSVDGVNYYKGMTLLSSVENVSTRCQGIVGGKWSDAFTYAMAEENSGDNNENDNSSVISDNTQAVKTKDTKSSISLAYGASAKLSGSLYSDELITKVSIAIDGWNNSKDGVLVSAEPKTKSFDLSNFLIDAGSVPFNKAGEYIVDVWAKTTTYTNPKEPVFTFKVTVGAARKITLIVKNGSEYVSKALVKINDVSYYTDTNGKFVLDKAMASTHSIYVANQYYVFNGKIDTNRGDFYETIGCYTLPVVVKDESGNVIQGASVKLGNIQATYMGGKYLFENIAYGSYTLSVSKDGYVSINSNVKIDINKDYKNELSAKMVRLTKKVTSASTTTGNSKLAITPIKKPLTGGNSKVPVILIHGRSDNALTCWGALNGIANSKIKNNNTFMINNESYFYNIENQRITGTTKSENDLIYTLIKNGYKVDKDLFVFNYPNVDFVVKNALILQTYINNLKKKFNFTKFDLVGHSKGGLVSRYYIENLGGSTNVRRLISIDTPHWGSYGAFSSIAIPGEDFGVKLPCDIDLQPDSFMYGGAPKQMWEMFTSTPREKYIDYLVKDKNGNVIGCNQTPTLKYGKHVNTQYYFIAAINYWNEDINLKNYSNKMIDIEGEKLNASNISNYLVQWDFENNNSYFSNILRIKEPAEYLVSLINDPSTNSLGDDIVNLNSQLGLNGNKQIAVKKASIYVEPQKDSIIMHSLLDYLHSKAQHRKLVMNKVVEYLSE